MFRQDALPVTADPLPIQRHRPYAAVPTFIFRCGLNRSFHIASEKCLSSVSFTYHYTKSRPTDDSQIDKESLPTGHSFLGVAGPADCDSLVTKMLLTALKTLPGLVRLRSRRVSNAPSLRFFRHRAGSRSLYPGCHHRENPERHPLREDHNHPETFKSLAQPQPFCDSNSLILYDKHQNGIASMHTRINAIYWNKSILRCYGRSDSPSDGVIAVHGDPQHPLAGTAIIIANSLKKKSRSAAGWMDFARRSDKCQVS